MKNVWSFNGNWRRRWMVVKPVVQWKSAPARLTGMLLLWPFSVLTWILSGCRGLIKGKARVKLPTYVVSVGSLTVGGSGKTPLVEFLARKLQESGICVGVVTTGYKKRSSGAKLVSDRNSIRCSVEEAGDESFLLARRLPGVCVAAGADRVAAARLLFDTCRPEIVVFDNAAQYHRMQKDVEILVHDCLEFNYPQLMLPIGRMKDGNWRSGSAIWLITRAEGREQTGDFTSTYTPSSLKNLFDQSEQGFGVCKGRKVLVFCGLGFPESFEHQVCTEVERYGGIVESFMEFQDHHWYTEKDVLRVCSKAGNPDDYLILTTEKDAVKIRPEWIPPADRKITYFVLSNFVVHLQDRFMQAILREFHHG